MSQLSLTGSLRTCKVDQGWASRIQSDRFENPELLVCPVWSGYDNANRPVCVDSYYTKSPGCNSPLDRIDVENYLRPQYMEYINLDAEGFRYNQDIQTKDTKENYGSCNNSSTNMECYNAGIRTINLEQLPKITGNFNISPNGAQIYPRCTTYPENRAIMQEAVVAQNHRNLEAMQHNVITNNMRESSGM